MVFREPGVIALAARVLPALASAPFDVGRIRIFLLSSVSRTGEEKISEIGLTGLHLACLGVVASGLIRISAPLDLCTGRP